MRNRWWNRDLAALGVWAGYIAAVAIVGIWLNNNGFRLFLAAPPLHARWEPRIGAWMLPAILFAAASPLLIRRTRNVSWPLLLVLVTAGGWAWAMLLALGDGPAAITRPLTTRFDYLAVLDRIDGIGSFLGTFTERVGGYPTHVKGHPPGIVVLLLAMERVGLAGPGWATAFFVLAGSSSPAAALLALRSVSGEAAARRIAPLLVFAPAVVWIATSGDALIAGVSAWSIALGVMATDEARKSPAMAVAGGVLFGIALLMSYGMALCILPVIAVALVRKRPGRVVIFGVAALVILAMAWMAGFNWIEGLLATRQLYLSGAARLRPYGYFLFATLAAFAIACGPVLLRRGFGGPKQGRQAAALMLGSIAMVLVADLSGMSKGEVERIWLPFVPWVLTSAAGLERIGLWTGAQVVTGIAVQTLLRTPW